MTFASCRSIPERLLARNGCFKLNKINVWNLSSNYIAQIRGFFPVQQLSYTPAEQQTKTFCDVIWVTCVGAD